MEKSDLLQVVGDLPYVIAICLFGWLIVKAIKDGVVKAFEIWKDLATVRNDIDLKRTQLDEKNVESITTIAKLMDAAVTRLERLAQTEKELKDVVTDQHQVVLVKMSELDKHVAVEVEDLKLVRDQQYKSLQERLDIIQQKLDVVTNDIKGLPKVVAEVETISKIIAELRLLIENSKIT